MGPTGTGTPASVFPHGHSRGGETIAGTASDASSMDVGVRPQQRPRGDTVTSSCHLSHITREMGGGHPHPSALSHSTDHLPYLGVTDSVCLRNLPLLSSRKVGIWKQLSAMLLPSQGEDCLRGVSQGPASRDGLGCTISSRPLVKDLTT